MLSSDKVVFGCIVLGSKPMLKLDLSPSLIYLMQRLVEAALSENSAQSNHSTNASVKAIFPMESEVILSHPVFFTIKNQSKGKSQSLELMNLNLL